MGRLTHTRQLDLWMNGERVGIWRVAPTGDELIYDDAWVLAEQGRPLSLSLPFRPGNQPHTGKVVQDYFDNLLPDSQPIRERLARRFKTQTTGAADLLAEIGRDCVGSLQIMPAGQAPGPVKRLTAQHLDEAAVAHLLRATVTPPSLDARTDPLDDFRISIAGAQEKTALLWHNQQLWQPTGPTPTTHILKLPLGMVGNMKLDLRESVDNEWLCAQILAAYGLPTARCHPLIFEDQKVLAVERFDRRWADDATWLIRLPQEDMCQATGTPAHAKYEADGGPGIDRILTVLNASRRRAQDRAIFFQAQLVFWLLCAPDGHAKNFSIAHQAGGAFSMTPLYDVMSAYPVLGAGTTKIAPQRIKLAMALRCTHPHWRISEIQRRHWVQVGRRNGVISAAGQDAESLIQHLVDRTPTVVAKVAAALPADFSIRIADAILGGLAAAAKRL